MHQNVETALKHLTVICNRSALHPLDEDQIKLHLRVLNKHDIPLNAGEIQAWLQANGWQEGPVKKVVAWATSISNGGRVQIQNSPSMESEQEVWKRVQSD